MTIKIDAKCAERVIELMEQEITSLKCDLWLKTETIKGLQAEIEKLKGGAPDGKA